MSDEKSRFLHEAAYLESLAYRYGRTFSDILDACEKDPAVLESLRPELERIHSILTARGGVESQETAGRMIVVMEGGLVTQVLRPDSPAAGPVSVAIVDYDTDGADPDELVSIPQQGYPAKEFADARAHIEPVARCAPGRFDEIWHAVEEWLVPEENNLTSPS